MTLRDIFRSLPLVLGLVLGIFTGRIGLLVTRMTGMMLNGRRQALWRVPDEVGLPAEPVLFQSSDGLTLHGWFIRATGDAPMPAVVIVHGWPWNRLGNRGDEPMFLERPVDLLEPARALHEAGFHVLMFDLRNHGLSDMSPPVTFGVYEARDLVAAVTMLRERPEVDGRRIGVLGYSMGANTLMFGIPECQPIRAAVAVQPVPLGIFGPRAMRDLLGPIGPILFQAAAWLPRLFGAPALYEIDPTPSARRLGETAVLYVQGAGDRWGTLAAVEAMAAITPHAQPVVVVPSDERYGGYQYVGAHADRFVAFFKENML